MQGSRQAQGKAGNVPTTTSHHRISPCPQPSPIHPSQHNHKARYKVYKGRLAWAYKVGMCGGKAAGKVRYKMFKVKGVVMWDRWGHKACVYVW